MKAPYKYRGSPYFTWRWQPDPRPGFYPRGGRWIIQSGNGHIVCHMEPYIRDPASDEGCYAAARAQRIVALWNKTSTP